jgi:hypothetical protein
MAAKVSGRARIAGMGLRVPPGPTRNCCVQHVTGTEPSERPRCSATARHESSSSEWASRTVCTWRAIGVLTRWWEISRHCSSHKRSPCN